VAASLTAGSTARASTTAQTTTKHSG
jgi:hypothetical protein